MKTMKNLVNPIVFLFLFLPLIKSSGQTTVANTPKNYFINPLGIPISLSANFGELRPNHWHMGLDIRTNQRVDYPVYAAADGYVARIGIKPLGFGRFIVINHPNGFSTLYAHLNEFFPELEKYAVSKQHEKESWEIDLPVPANMFKVKKGERIAKSGTTGGSQGPHLHFEIRDTKTDRCINPQLFGLPINDITPPSVSMLAVYDRNMSTHFQNPQIIKLTKTSKGYITSPQKISTNTRNLSFAISAVDRVNPSSGPNGIYSAILFFDNVRMSSFKLDSIDYIETTYIDAQIDKKYRNNGGAYLQHLSILPGFKGNIYEKSNGNGIIHLDDAGVHSVRIEIYDVYKNKSVINFDIQFNESVPGKNRQEYNRVLVPNRANVIEEKEFQAYMADYNLYDTVPLDYNLVNTVTNNAVTAVHQFGNGLYPVHSGFKVSIKPITPVNEVNRNKIVIERKWKNDRDVRKANWQNGWLTASFSDFGSFQAFVDNEEPKINAPGKGSDTLDLSALKRLVFTPTDNFAVSSFRAELDNKWLMFSNDKGRNYIYYFDDQCPYGTHKLKVTIEDIAGNVTEKVWWFKRHAYTPPKKKPAVKKKTAPRKK